MSTKRATTQQSTEAVATEPRIAGKGSTAVAAQPGPAALSNIARQIYASVKSRLESEFETFLESSTLEEKRLMIEIFNNHGSVNMGPDPRGIGQYDVPLYGAIQRQLDDCLCVVVPDDEMIGPVEDFIVSLEKKRYKRTPWRPGQFTQDELIAQHEEAFRSEVELFARDAKLPSFLLMHSIFARWNELARDPDLDTLPNTLAVAAQIELDKLRADTAAEKAKKDA